MIKKTFMLLCAIFVSTPLIADDDAQSIAVDAYIWGYPLVVMQRTKQLMTQPKSTPLNAFRYMDELVTPQFKEVVTPNVDTLYATAWLELQKQAIILDVPEMKDRYYCVQFLDAFTNNFAYVGTRATGTQKGRYLIVGPDWHGTVPPGTKIIQTPTINTWLIVRVVVKGKDDLATARSLLKQITLSPAKGRFAPYYSKKPRGTPQDVAKAGVGFFDELCDALVLNTPPANENDLMEKFATIGIAKGRKPSTDAKLRSTLTQAVNAGESEINDKIENISTSQNGWKFNLNVGDYGTDYLLRAAVAKSGLGANIPDEAVYAIATTDTSGNALVGNKRYVIHFGKDELPPVKGFWSVTMYNQDKFLVDNPMNRYAIGSYTPNLKYKKDGSLDIYVQYKTPRDTTNWLPAPADAFWLVLRMYLPDQSVIDNTYKYPTITTGK